MSAAQARRGGPADAPQVAELFALCLREAWPAEGIGRALSEPGGRLILLDEDSGLAGALLLRAEAGEAEVLLVAVRPECRGSGLGSLLLRAGEAAAIEAGAERCFLEVRAGNVAARGLYEGAGYRQVGCRAGYYRDGEDALVLARDLAPNPLPGA